VGTTVGNVVLTAPANYYATDLAAQLTDTSLSHTMFYPYWGESFGYKIMGGDPLGMTATAMLPYFFNVPVGLYLAKKGVENKNLVQAGIGAGMATSPLWGGFGKLAIAAKSLAATISSNPIIGYAAIALLVGATYKLGKSLGKAIFWPEEENKDNVAHAAAH